ncbi:adipogenesis regulatory factor-like [Pituophis catenifer annectens]|uniref:adipogenesis regulatory factor-like n=1 Tax=Pituophis catenifer annectens TaxID=94852 RepID=UPI0039919E24
MFKFNLSEETSKIGNTAQDAVNSAGQTVQHVLDQATETGQKVIDDTCKTAQDTGEKAMQNVTGQITALGKSFGQSGEKKEEKKVST